MAQQQAPDDIFALYCRFDLDVSQYQVFERRPAAKETSSRSGTNAAAAERPPAGPKAATGEGGRSEVHASIPSRPALSAKASDGFSEKTKERAGLTNLLANLQHMHERSVATNIGPCCSPVTVFGLSGGVGVTTVMATLARQFSQQGLRCGLYDETPDSILPLFFGCNRPIATASRFAALHSVLDSSIRLLSADSIPAHAGPQAGESVRERLVRAFAHEFDFLLSDAERGSRAVPAGAAIFVALPDLPSLVQLRSFVDKTGWLCQNEDAICVLNRFDPEFELHRELLSWYEGQFAQVVTVRHSNLIPESLAEGTSVIDWAPESDVSDDFVRLAACVRQTSARTGASPKKLESVRIQSDGLALCS